jgi:hypothetical protein
MAEQSMLRVEQSRHRAVNVLRFTEAEAATDDI